VLRSYEMKLERANILIPIINTIKFLNYLIGLSHQEYSPEKGHIDFQFLFL